MQALEERVTQLTTALRQRDERITALDDRLQVCLFARLLQPVVNPTLRWCISCAIASTSLLDRGHALSDSTSVIEV